MDDSLSTWLALREGADWASRSEALVQRVRAAIPSNAIDAVDLCTGSGSNLRYLMDRLPGQQRWLVVDRDAGVLAEVPARLSSWARARGRNVHADGHGVHVRGDQFECDVDMRQLDLNRLDDGIFTGRHLVTASALLDLVSEDWLHTLAVRCRDVGAAALFSITYNGQSSCDPAEPEDEMVRELMNRHQKTDKGLGGLAAGPDACAVAERVFTEASYQVERAASDWQIGPHEQAFQRMLIDGWAQAAIEIAPQHTAAIAAWLERRRAHTDAGRCRIVVGHDDMAAWIARQ
jgi:hypothetical protein